ncbi:DUF2029 domain-containing protein [Thermoleophilia bacterium SCSIO 60948]|nr:DUF2029 domain-containing protein [Thermoleophilia bacterium SCSIO 60948]
MLPRLEAARRLATMLVVLAAAVLASPAAALAQTDAPAPPSVPSADIPQTPETYQVSGRRAVRIADSVDVVREQAAERGELVAQPRVAANIAWEVGFFDGDEEVAQVTLDAVSGEVREAWDGYQVAWRMARGYDEQFGHKLNAPYVWIPLALAFFFALFDPRRPFRIAHLDLLVLLSFGVSNFFFNEGRIDLSVPLAYPPLLYLLARMLWIGFRGRTTGLRPWVSTTALAIAILFLVGFRLAFNVVDSGVIDVGYAGTIGADKITHGERIWGEGSYPDENGFGDTYGPANYLFYVPFELALPWSGEWDSLPSAHAAAIGFDLLALLGLFFAGRALGARRRGPPGVRRSAEEHEADRARGTRIGVIMAFAWAAYPYSMYALQSNSNDALVAAALAWTLAAFASPAGRGAFLGLATMVKFAPLPLAPLFAVGERGLLDRLRPLRPLRRGGWPEPVMFSVAFGAVVGGLLLIPAIGEGLGTFYERAIATQLDRESPFSIWGLTPSLAPVQHVVQAAAVAIAVLVAFVPRRRSARRVAALSAAVLITSQVALDHWFYLYIPWFLVGIFAAISHDEPEPEASADPAGQIAGSDEPPADPVPAPRSAGIAG